MKLSVHPTISRLPFFSIAIDWLMRCWKFKKTSSPILWPSVCLSLLFPWIRSYVHRTHHRSVELVFLFLSLTCLAQNSLAITLPEYLFKWFLRALLQDGAIWIDFFHLATNQSINQSINQSSNQSVNQSIFISGDSKEINGLLHISSGVYSDLF